MSAKKVSGLSLNDSEETGMGDEGDVYTMNSDFKASPGSPPAVKGLDLSLAVRSFEREELGFDNVSEEEITVIFDLPDGSQGEKTFKLGHTVEYLKSFVESEYGIPMTEQNLYLEDKLLMDPLSLNDYPSGIQGGEMWVRVDGILPAESKK